jgi:hypothetical protein
MISGIQGILVYASLCGQIPEAHGEPAHAGCYAKYGELELGTSIYVEAGKFADVVGEGRGVGEGGSGEEEGYAFAVDGDSLC